MTTLPNPVCVTDVVNEIGEGPLWSPRDQSLYWIDSGPVAKTLMRYQPATGATVIHTLPQRAASVARRADGGLLIGFQRGLAVLDADFEHLQELELDGVDFSRERFNDSAVDRAGRLWIGSFDRKLDSRLGALYCIRAGKSAQAMDTGFMMSNGIAWSPDNRTLYFCDSRPGRIYAYDFELSTGRIANRRIFMDFAGRAGRPDGCAIDSMGCLWVAEVGGSQILRLAPDGSTDYVLRLPVSKPTSIAFGGDDMKTLFITSMTFGLSDNERKTQPLAGRLLSVETDVQGVPEPELLS